jgi:tetratricopeptide (TPR) repeat protein
MGLRAFRGFALGDRPADYRSTRELIGSSGFVPAVTALGAAAYVDDLTGSERFATLLAKHPRSCEVRGLGRRMLAQAALARGLPDSATGWLRSPEACDSAASLQLLAVYQSLPFVFTDRPTVRELLGVLLAGRPASNVSWQEAAVPIYGIGLIALAAGDSALAGREASTLDSMGDSTGDRALAWSLTQSLRGRIALHRGEVSRALGFLERARWEQVPVPPVVEVDDRYLRAELLARLGRDEEAAGWYGSIAERASHELVYLAPAQFRLAQIHDRQGDDAKALAYYQRFLQLWREAEPGLHPFIVESRRRVNELQASTTYR